MSTIIVVATPDAGYSRSGAGWSTQGSGGYQGGAFDYHGAGTGETATFVFALPQPGIYKVAITYLEAFNRNVAVPVSVKNGATPVLTTTIDQTATPSDFTYNGSGFKTLSDSLTFAATASVTLTVTGDPTYTIADAVYFEFVGESPLPIAGTASVAANTGTLVSIDIATNAGGEPPYTNQLQRSPRGAGTWADVGSPVAGATATLTDATVASTTDYDFRIHVTDSAGTPGSAYSDILAVTTPGPHGEIVDPQVLSLQVSPSGNVLLVRFTNNVASVLATGATYSVDGGAPIALANPAYDAGSGSDFVWYALGPNRSIVALDDSTDATLLGAGWVNKNSGNTHFDPGYHQFANSQFSQSSGASDTATYAHTMSSAGRYRVSAGIVWLYGPDRTMQQVYTVSDGVGVVGTFTVDMTEAPSWDDVDNLIRLHDLGHVTLRDTSLSIVVSNGAGSGNLVTDAIVLTLEPLPACPPGSTVVFDAPSGTFTTTAGSVGVNTLAPVTPTTDADWFPFDPDRPRTMQVGYNKTFDTYEYGARTYTDRWRSSPGWRLSSGTFGTDDRGNLTSLSGLVGLYLWTPFGGSDEVAGWPNVPLSGTAVFRFHNPLGATDPGCYMSNTQSPGYTFGRVWTGVPDADGKYTLKIPFTHPDFVPLGQATAPYYNQNTYEVAFNTSNVITDLEIYIEEEVPEGWDSIISPIVIERYKDRGFGVIRFLDSMAGNGGNTVEYEDWTPPGVAGYW
jgi:hypothetical protein